MQLIKPLKNEGVEPNRLHLITHYKVTMEINEMLFYHLYMMLDSFLLNFCSHGQLNLCVTISVHIVATRQKACVPHASFRHSLNATFYM